MVLLHFAMAWRVRCQPARVGVGKAVREGHPLRVLLPSDNVFAIEALVSRYVPRAIRALAPGRATCKGDSDGY